MKKTLIVSGGKVELVFLKKYLEQNYFDYIIASDKGLEALDELKITPNCILGDFDSIKAKILNKYLRKKGIEIVKLNPMKDYTDTHMAIKKAIKEKSTQIVIFGAIGTRVDHLIANINILKETLDKKIDCTIINSKNEITLIDRKTIIKKDSNYPFISLIPLTTKVSGITLKGFKYNLCDAVISIGESIGVSNEQIEEKASIDIKKGILILIKSKD